MKINTITIRRRPSYERSKGDNDEFMAEIEVQGDSRFQPTIKIHLSEDQLTPIVNIVAQIVAGNMASAAESFAAEVAAMGQAVIEHDPAAHITAS